jgi:hypothetical protein
MGMLTRAILMKVTEGEGLEQQLGLLLCCNPCKLLFWFDQVYMYVDSRLEISGIGSQFAT